MTELATDRSHRLGFRAFVMFLGRGIVLGFILLAGVGAAWWYRASYLPEEYEVYTTYGFKLLALFVGAYLFYRFARAYLAYRAHEYRFDEEYFHITRGYLDRHETGVIYQRIQTVTVQRPITARMMGIAHLTILTGAGAADHGGNHVVHLPSLDLRKARLVQKELLARARHRQGESQQAKYAPVPFDEEDEEEDGSDGI